MTAQKRLTLHFEGDTLARIEGDYTPDEVSERQVLTENEVFEVPDWQDPGRSIFEQAASAVGLEIDNELDAQ